jgi:hypothetical protein
MASTLAPERSSRPGALWHVLAASGALALLLAFGQVLVQAVLDGEQRRQAMARLGRATWQCNALRVRAERLACLDQLRAVAPGAASQPVFDAIALRYADRAGRP